MSRRNKLTIQLRYLAAPMIRQKETYPQLGKDITREKNPRKISRLS